MAEMSKREIWNFLMRGTLTGKLATVEQDGSSHVVPVWFIVEKHGNHRQNDIVF
jgi:hypothetical protein